MSRDTAEQRAQEALDWLNLTGQECAHLKIRLGERETLAQRHAHALARDVLALAAENERLRQERDEWRETCEVLEDGTGARLLAAERDELAAEIERLREALTAIRDRGSYVYPCHAVFKGDCEDRMREIARAALGDGERQ